MKACEVSCRGGVWPDLVSRACQLVLLVIRRETLLSNHLPKASTLLVVVPEPWAQGSVWWRSVRWRSVWCVVEE